MKPTGESVDEFIANVTPEVRRRDALTLLEIYRRVTGLPAETWGTIIGFGACHYVYPTGTEGDMPLAAFSPRKASMTVYLMEGFDDYAEELSALGAHTASKSCLYIKDLAKVDLTVLEGLIAESYRRTLNHDNDTEYAHITITSPAQHTGL